MKRRTITITLTEEQFRKLAGACALAEAEWAEMASDTGERARDVEVLDRAWLKISRAWHGKGRP